MSISAHFQQVPVVRAGVRTRVGRSLTCCNKECIEVLSLQSGVGVHSDVFELWKLLLLSLIQQSITQC